MVYVAITLVVILLSLAFYRGVCAFAKWWVSRDA